MRAAYRERLNSMRHLEGKRTFNDFSGGRKAVIRMNPDHTLTVERVQHYLSITQKAREKATPMASTPEEESMVKTLLSMADDYANDAQYFLNKVISYERLEPSTMHMHGLMQASNFVCSMGTETMSCSRCRKLMMLIWFDF